jgi:isopentenyl-diphosphate Delta-isomerase
MPEEQVVLVNDKDDKIGLMDKMQAHIDAVLHRAFSVFVFNSNDELLLQQRALTKYHTPGLWTNTCCSHPRDGESPEQAARRRLMEEMGMECKLNKAFDFIYKADVGQGLTEHEFDHVFVGYSDVLPVINKNEVEAYRYVSLENVRNEMQANPHEFTVWFRIAFDRVEAFFNDNRTINNIK